jgi:putative PIN family toxin of toxin-antitoxin system
MRVILDTNVLLSALMTTATPPDLLYEAWTAGRFTLLISDQQLDELREVTRRPTVQERITNAEAGRMVNDLRILAERVHPLPQIDASPDPLDNFLLAMAKAGQADLLVTGDKRGLLQLERFGGTRIVTARQALGLLGN